MTTMASDYIGRYGEALKRLTALEQDTGFTPIDVSGGAFSGTQGAPVTTGAFDVARAPRQQGAIDQAEGPPISAAELWKQMPAEQKDALLKQLGHVDVDQEYDRMVSSGAIAPTKKNPTKHDKLGYIAEVALRTLSNMGRPGDQGINAWADAVLDTDTRRAAVDQAQMDRNAAALERARLETREDTKEARKNKREDAEVVRKQAADIAAAEGKNAFEAEQNRLQRESAERIAGMRDDKPRQILYDAQGRAFDAQTGDPVMVNVPEERRGRRGRPGYTVASKQQLKTVPKFAGGSSADPDRVVYEIGQRAKALREDRKARKQIEDLAKQNGVDFETALQRIATQQVQSQYELASGGPAPSPATGLSAEDQAMLNSYLK